MNNIFGYCEIEGGKVADVSLELLTKGRALADTLGCELEALALGQGLAGVEKQLAEYGADVENLLYQIRPAFGGNIIATIINPDHRPQMATVREGVMKKEKARTPGKGVVRQVDAKKYLSDADFAVRIIDRQIEERKIDICCSSWPACSGPR